MESYFDKIMEGNYGINLMIDFEIEFHTEEREKPNNYELSKYIDNKKKEIIDTATRLNPYEKILYFEKLNKDLNSISEDNLRVFTFFLKLTTEQILSTFPKYRKEFQENSSITVSNEEFLILEKKYGTLRVFFYDTKNQLISFLNKISQPAAPERLNIEAVEEKKEKTFIEYLSHPQKEQLAEKLKNEFETEKAGKNFALMINSLQKRKILNLSNGSYSKLYNAIETYFNRQIGSKTVLNNFKIAFKDNFGTYKDDYNSIDNRIEILVNTVEKEKNRL